MVPCIVCLIIESHSSFLSHQPKPLAEERFFRVRFALRQPVREKTLLGCHRAPENCQASGCPQRQRRKEVEENVTRRVTPSVGLWPPQSIVNRHLQVPC